MTVIDSSLYTIWNYRSVALTLSGTEKRRVMAGKVSIIYQYSTVNVVVRKICLRGMRSQKSARVGSDNVYYH